MMPQLGVYVELTRYGQGECKEAINLGSIVRIKDDQGMGVTISFITGESIDYQEDYNDVIKLMQDTMSTVYAQGGGHQ